MAKHLWLSFIILVLLFSFRLVWRSSTVPTNPKPTATGLFVLPHNPKWQFKNLNLIKAKAPAVVSRIIILAPNHKDIGADIISDRPAPMSGFNLAIDKDFVKNEYAVSLLVDWLKPLYPQANISAFIFRRHTKIDKLTALSHFIDKPGILVVASVDFAHYLDREVSLANDDKTLKLLQTNDHPNLSQLSSDYTDCGECLIIISLLASRHGKDWQVIDHSYEDKTSYFWLSAD